MNSKSLTLLLTWSSLMTVTAEQSDPFLWLEDIDGEKSMAWVEEHNAVTTNRLEKHPEFKPIYDQTLEILNSKERIAYPGIRGNFLYNFWQDETYPRGVWRRTRQEDYLKEKWEVILDVGKLAENEEEAWSYKGVDVLQPDVDTALVKLSRGGGDAVVIREFDIEKKSFIEDGFQLKESKTRVAWLDRNTLLVGTDFGEGSMTSSGYPRQVKKWKRGTPLHSAELMYEGEMEDVSVGAFVQQTVDRNYVVVYRGISFYESEYRVLENGKLIKLDLPLDVDLSGFFKNHLLVKPKKEWTVAGQTLPAGSLAALNYDALLEGKHEVTVLFRPTKTDSLGDVSTTRNQLLVRVFKGGRSDELFCHSFQDEVWAVEKTAAPLQGTLSIVSADDYSDRLFLTHESALSPRTLYFSDNARRFEKIKSMPGFFDASGYMVKFHEARSKDGTMIPYSIVLPRDKKENEAIPTLLYGYGGFEVSLRPWYSPVMGSAWLGNGGAFVVANIRGGGEFGPDWHEAARKENKQRSYDDFIAVSEDLITRGYCTAETLGIQGGSNGGLLVGAVATQRPELYKAVVCSVPLLDMKRFNKLLAGASWMAEYGNPDLPEEWDYIRKYSPYHNLQKERKYPEIFFNTTTRDDRVHPAHARKMAALMEQEGYPFFYFENTEGGHGAGVTNEQKAYMQTLVYTYLLQLLAD